ncbi:L,D-transpeptidase [Nocardia aurantia]|uniref:L,D-transpeptidase 2 n=1 Tax=Nocardia aurantia TaxID=2585199 RepID=A0A7K0DKS2_9NOCA|nr:Ig-like domain-containing protein [Nocardia aurantia]MQY26309.1 L,D-transpeptidase 2 [Nocardia aurantia]
MSICRGGRSLGSLTAVSLVALLAVGCDRLHDASPAGQVHSALEQIRPKVAVPIKDGDLEVSPGVPVKVQVEDGTLLSVSLTAADGTVVPGQLTPDGHSWEITQPLDFSTAYRLRAEAVGLGGKTTSNMNFATLTPRVKTHPYLDPNDEEVVGVGQPVALRFDENVPDRKAAQDLVKITTTPPVEGAFYWINNREVRWRPEHYWAPGTQVTIDVNGYGKSLGEGVVVDGDVHSAFTVGEATFFNADDSTKTVVVERNGQVIRTMPTSMGKDSTPTENGIYIIADRNEQIIMDSSTYGVPSSSPDGYRTPVDYATRMSYNGTFMHSAPWSVGAQGSYDTSHGCLNLSPEDARWVYENAKRGDVAVVRNTSGDTLSGVDGLGDWNIPWAEWKAGNADNR